MEFIMGTQLRGLFDPYFLIKYRGSVTNPWLGGVHGKTCFGSIIGFAQCTVTLTTFNSVEEARGCIREQPEETRPRLQIFRADEKPDGITLTLVE